MRGLGVRLAVLATVTAGLVLLTGGGSEVTAEDTNQLVNGDFTSGLSGWTAGTGGLGTQTVSVVESDPPFSDVIELKSTGAGSTGASSTARQDIYLDVTDALSVVLEADVEVVSATVVDGCGTEGRQYPLNITVNYQDSASTLRAINWGFFFGGGTCGRPFVWPHEQFFTISVPQEVWFHFTSENLKDLAPDMATITLVWVGGTGWDYTGRADNLGLFVHAGTTTPTLSFTPSPIFVPAPTPSPVPVPAPPPPPIVGGGGGGWIVPPTLPGPPVTPTPEATLEPQPTPTVIPTPVQAPAPEQAPDATPASTPIPTATSTAAPEAAQEPVPTLPEVQTVGSPSASGGATWPRPALILDHVIAPTATPQTTEEPGVSAALEPAYIAESWQLSAPDPEKVAPQPAGDVEVGELGSQCPILVEGSSGAGVDGDTACNDLSGNGRLDFHDVVQLFRALGDPTLSDGQKAAFDYDGDGRFSIADVVSLFDRKS